MRSRFVNAHAHGTDACVAERRRRFDPGRRYA
jgi:hypothetical protein